MSSVFRNGAIFVDKDLERLLWTNKKNEKNAE